MDRAQPHLSEEQLAALQDRESGPLEAAHLESCAECGRRLRELQSASAAYVEYRDRIRGPALPPPPVKWQPLAALIEQHQSQQRVRLWPVAVLAAAAAVVLAVVMFRTPVEQPEVRAAALLSQSARVPLPEGRFLAMRSSGRTLLRPAVLASGAEADPALARWRAAFESAGYSWPDPLNAGSFQSWRARQRDRRDIVTETEGGGERLYRVRTESPYGSLHAAALTLRARDLRPTAGDFEFTHEGSLEISEASAPAATSMRQPPAPVERQSSVETPATPSDVLRVLAALDEIGADAGEPVDVSADAASGKVEVTANGLSAGRRRQVNLALAGLPRVRLSFDVAGSPVPRERFAAPERSSIPDAMRRQLEDRIGGPVALQEATDRVLDSAASLLGRARAMTVLARLFPPSVESALGTQDRTLLLVLRQRHVAEMERLSAQIHTGAKKLLGPVNPQPEEARDSWQSQASALFVSVQALDDSLNRLLAGSYTQVEGEAILARLGGRWERADAAIRVQKEAAK
jgi:hypothetical protein